jgi:hypothetical protein
MPEWITSPGGRHTGTHSYQWRYHRPFKNNKKGDRQRELSSRGCLPAAGQKVCWFNQCPRAPSHARQYWVSLDKMKNNSCWRLYYITKKHNIVCWFWFYWLLNFKLKPFSISFQESKRDCSAYSEKLSINYAKPKIVHKNVYLQNNYLIRLDNLRWAAKQTNCLKSWAKRVALLFQYVKQNSSVSPLSDHVLYYLHIN